MQFNEFCASLSIPPYTYQRRQKDLLHWLTFFYSFTFKKGTPSTITIHSQFASYQPLPAKPQFNLLMSYVSFVAPYLQPDYSPINKTAIARKAIPLLGPPEAKPEQIAQSYVSQALSLIGETNGEHAWIDLSSKTPIPSSLLPLWQNQLRQQWVKAEETSYEELASAFAEEHGYYPIYTSYWRKRG